MKSPGTLESFALADTHLASGLIEAMLALRLILQLLGANPASAFIAWVYGVTDAFVWPFAGAFPTLTVGAFAIEFSTIFAMIGYAVIGWLIGRVFAFIFDMQN